MPATARRTRTDIAALLADDAIRAVYQPIVDLATGAVIGYEALARGPEHGPLESPAALFGAARAAGLLEPLEWACRAAALRGALRAELPASTGLFVNVEPGLAGTPPPPHVAELLDAARSRVQIICELTERAVTARPAELLRHVGALRDLGAAIAVDDVGADARSLGLMPFLEPDVIKLDMRLMHGRHSAANARIVHAVSAEAERSGARIVAEGIETAVEVDRARVLGADLGQGWHFGRPGPLPAVPVALGGLYARSTRRPSARTPFEIVARHRTVRRGPKALLLEMSRQIEARLVQEGAEAVLLATFQDARHFTPATARRYERLSRSAAFVGALGHGLGPEPVPGVRGGSLEPDEPLRREWNVAVVAPHFAAAFVGRDLGDGGEDGARRFDFAVTHDRSLAIEAAAAMMARIAPLS